MAVNGKREWEEPTNQPMLTACVMVKSIGEATEQAELKNLLCEILRMQNIRIDYSGQITFKMKRDARRMRKHMAHIYMTIHGAMPECMTHRKGWENERRK